MKGFVKSIVVALGICGLWLNGASADTCTEKKCSYDYIGIGGLYSSFDAGSSADIGAKGGYLAFGGANTYYQRFKVGADMRLGGGQNSFSGSIIEGVKSSAGFYYVGFEIKLGVNILAKEVPLWLNVISGYDFTYGGHIDSRIAYIGGELEGILPSTSSKMQIQYGGGYSWVPFAGHTLLDNEIGTSTRNYSYQIHAFVGIIYALNEKSSYFLRGVFRYRDIGASKEVLINGANAQMPAATSYTAMIETGIRF